MRRLILASLAAALSVAACATPTVYGPAATANGVGYHEYRIEPGRYRITFQGGPGAPVQQVQDYALLRAADLAVANGYDWFRVADRFVQGQPNNGPRVGVGVGGGSADWGYHGGSSVGVGVGTSFNLGGGPSIASTIEVFMGRGERPRGVDVYDARAIQQSLRGDRV